MKHQNLNYRWPNCKILFFNLITFIDVDDSLWRMANHQNNHNSRQKSNHGLVSSERMKKYFWNWWKYFHLSTVHILLWIKLFFFIVWMMEKLRKVNTTIGITPETIESSSKFSTEKNFEYSFIRVKSWCREKAILKNIQFQWKHLSLDKKSFKIESWWDYDESI